MRKIKCATKVHLILFTLFVCFILRRLVDEQKALYSKILKIPNIHPNSTKTTRDEEIGKHGQRPFCFIYFSTILHLRNFYSAV